MTAWAITLTDVDDDGFDATVREAFRAEAALAHTPADRIAMDVALRVALDAPKLAGKDSHTDVTSTGDFDDHGNGTMTLTVAVIAPFTP